MRFALSLCLIFAFAMPAAASETRELVLGDLALTYDPAHWTLARVQESEPLLARPGTVRARCIDCGHDAFVMIGVADMAREESEAVLDPMWVRNRHHSSLTVGEITVAITTTHSPCRNYVPSSLSARAACRGRTYTFHSGTIVGCHGSTGVGSERFKELLRGLHPHKQPSEHPND